MVSRKTRARVVAAAALAALVASVGPTAPGGRQVRADEPARATVADGETPREHEPPPPARAPLLGDRQRAAAADGDAEPRPFWKSWLFWTVAGALIVGGAALAVYSTSGGDGNLDPCPGEINASLGCFGAGRDR